jgi:uncharacterized repeat protein (TIGR02543 family)
MIENRGTATVVISGVCAQISFNDKIAPYAYNPVIDGNNHPYDTARLFSGGPTDSITEFEKYCYTPTAGFQTVGSTIIQNDANDRFIGGKITVSNVNEILSITPGAAATIAHLYFMPKNGTDTLDNNMFRFEYQEYRLRRLSPWFGNGSRFVVYDIRTTSTIDTYVVSPSSFEIRIKSPQATVTFDGNGGTPGEQTRSVASGGTLGSNMPANPTRNGFTFTGWNTQANGSGTAFTASTPVGADIRVYAQWRSGDGGGDGGSTDIPDPGIPLAGFTADHIAYISGYPDNSVKPNNAITRAEVAMIFFRLLSDPDKNILRISTFSDVADGVWYTQAINYLTGIEILTGYPDGTFKPNRPITRAEFAAVASRFDKLSTTNQNAFPDSEGHWAKDYINSAYAKGWVGGYPDGTFKPQQNITRAEVVKIVNTMLDRKIHFEDIPEGIKNFTDIAGHWAYTEIVEASNDHDYTRKDDGYEIWTLK